MTENYDLTMERTYPPPPRAVYDAFVGMYGENRPDWIVESRLELRPGGSWRVVFHPPGLEAFTETGCCPVEPPHNPLLDGRALRRSAGLLDRGGTTFAPKYRRGWS
jgi:uncharacterized protein YndB with AHSA1/START domain